VGSIIPKAQWGQGKCLSRLQVQIAQGRARPAQIKLQKNYNTSGYDADSSGSDEEAATTSLSKTPKLDTSMFDAPAESNIGSGLFGNLSTTNSNLFGRRGTCVNCTRAQAKVCCTILLNSVY
jgi:hypothetical protein